MYIIKKIHYKIIRNLSYVLFKPLKIDNKKVVVLSYYGKGFGDNAKYIVENLQGKLKIYWGISQKNNTSSFPNYVTPVKYESIRFYYHLYTAKIWIDNSRKGKDIRKKPGQYYVQTWHGSIGFKKTEQDAIEKLSRGYVESAEHDAEMTDLMISGSKWSSNLYRSTFWYKNGEILEVGLPRNDILIQKDEHKTIIDKVKKYYKVQPKEKIFLYAPTFRDDGKLDYYQINFPHLKDTLEKKTGQKWKILVRLHPNISSKSKSFKSRENGIINATGYPDMQELIIASDMMMTDYSSCIFDFALMGRPGVLYAPDYNNYVEERGFYFNYFNLPFPVAQTEEELINIIEKFDNKDYNKKLSQFFKKIGLNETGKSAEKIAEIIIEKTK